MELLQQSLFSFVFVLLLTSLFLLTKTRKISKLNLPPAPHKLPFIGNLHQLTGSLPHRIFKDLSKKHGPIMHLQLGEVPLIIISSAEAAKEVMNNQDLTFADRPLTKVIELTTFNGSSFVFSPYGEYWRQLKRTCTLELLSSKPVLSYRSLREEGVVNLIESISSSIGIGEPVNLTKLIFSYNTNIICTVAFGNKCNEKDEFLRASIQAIKLGGGLGVPDMFPSYKFLHRISKSQKLLEKSHINVERILTKIIDNHQEIMKGGRTGIEESNAKDLVDVLLNLEENSDLEVPITKNTIKAVLREIFIAGMAPPSSVTEWAMSELIKNPRVMNKAQAEVRSILKGNSKIEEADIEHLDYLKLVIKETLRLHPTLPLLLPREARTKCKIYDYDVDIKTKVIINAWAIGIDPKYWTNPERFEPERFNNVSVIDFKGTNFSYIPFGAGRRMCPGMLFGLANVELLLAQLLYRFDWKLPTPMKPEDLDMSEALGIAVTRKNDLVLIATPYTL